MVVGRCANFVMIGDSCTSPIKKGQTLLKKSGPNLNYGVKVLNGCNQL